ncbi:Rod shape-determining protein MreC [hydrothermal vent metagenome]|uniref:Cell shape-determining protein MreC n=1 Tax=hydrothermal vent metagenome TaxID=652676 RepID=A0A3B1AB11_9ZZZZ
MDHRYRAVDNVRAALTLIVYPLNYIVNLPSEISSWASDTFVTRDTLQEQNNTLRTQNNFLEMQIQKLASLQAENIRLRELLQSSKKVGEKKLVAEIISVALDPHKRLIRLDKGSLDEAEPGYKVKPGLPLIDAQGVMGQITYTDLLNSVAILITDPSHTLPVQINRNGLRTILVGTGLPSSPLEIPYLPNNADIKVGDLLVTSGLGGVYPTGYPAAKVREISIDPSLPFAKIIAEPTANLTQGRQVLLIWPRIKSVKPLTQNTKQDLP